MSYHLSFEYELKQAKEQAAAEGRAEGRAEGIAQGRAEGIAEGRAEGRTEGRAEAIVSFVDILERYGTEKEKIREQIMETFHLSSEEYDRIVSGRQQ